MTKAFDVRLHCATLLLLLAWPHSHAQSLPELIDEVLSTHPSVRSQRALGESAKDAVEGAKWQFYPTPSIGFEQVDTSRSDPNYPSYGDKSVTTLRLQQPLWTGGRLTAGLERAQAGVRVSQATLDGTRQDLALRVVQLYADWYGAGLKREAFAQSLKAHRTLQQQINRRIGGGVSPASDLTLLLGRAQQTEADLSAAQAQEQTAVGRLTQLLGHALSAHALASATSTPQSLEVAVQTLLERAQAQNPNVVKLQAQAQAAQADIASARADLQPEVYVRAESQYGSYSVPGSPTLSRFFVGVSSRLGAGLSSLTQVGAAQARFEAAQADIDSTRLSLGEQIQADYAQAQAGQGRIAALQASLESADNITRAWNRQFVAGHKTWPDVMNAVREQAQLQAQIADARAAQLLLNWRLAIVGQGLDGALASAQAQLAVRAQQPGELGELGEVGEVGEIGPLGGAGTASARAAIPLYAQSPGDAIELRMASHIDPLNLGVGMGASEPASAPKNSEGLW